MSTWRVDEAAQRAFADLSGDHNPIHLDALVARRTPFGRVAVHGMHLLLDALERLSSETSSCPRRVRSTFHRSVGLGDDVPRSVADIHDEVSLGKVREWKKAQKAAKKDKQDRPIS